MSLFDSSTRNQLRQAYADAWRKRAAGTPLSALEAMLADIIGIHPEYHSMVGNAAEALAFEPGALPAGENPFLHMGLHVAVREQIAIDRPPGVRQVHRELQIRWGGVHDAEHMLMEALAQILWEAQRAGKPPDEREYLNLARNRLAASHRR